MNVTVASAVVEALVYTIAPLKYHRAVQLFGKNSPVPVPQEVTVAENAAFVVPWQTVVAPPVGALIVDGDG